jgi:hypothetical protein
MFVELLANGITRVFRAYVSMWMKHAEWTFISASLISFSVLGGIANHYPDVQTGV